MYKTKKNKALLILWKILLFLGLLLLFYFQWDKIKWSDQKGISLVSPLALLGSILLIPLNVGIEKIKWKLTLKQSKIASDPSTINASFYAGWVSGLLTPNMLGNFIGRMYYFQKSERIIIILQTLIANFAQFIPSILFGLIALLFLQKLPTQNDLSEIQILLVSLSLLFILALYFNLHHLPFQKIHKANWLKRLAQILKSSLGFRTKLLLWSILRHLIFTTQFFLMLNAFQNAWEWDHYLWIWQLYLWSTLTPSLFIGKLMVRESLAVWIFTQVGLMGFPILISSLLIWTGNVLLPGIFGLFFIKKTKE